MINIPPEVSEWLRGVFRNCNLHATAKLDRNPFAYEEHLDISVVEVLQQDSVPVRFSGEWTVHINTHFLGKTRMLGNFEVADIGFLVIFRTATQFVRSKVALLQSKRLFPDSVEPETDFEIEERYMSGFGGLYSSDNDFTELLEERIITFDKNSRYKALLGNSQQTKIIDDYENSVQIPVYYLLYNPSTLPHSVNVPASVKHSAIECRIGARVVPAKTLHALLGSSTVSPSFADLEKLPAPFKDADAAGWPLDKFVVDLLLQCKVGRITDIRNDEGLYEVFYRRSRPLATAISVTIDAPAGFDWSVEPQLT